MACGLAEVTACIGGGRARCMPSKVGSDCWASIPKSPWEEFRDKRSDGESLWLWCHCGSLKIGLLFMNGRPMGSKWPSLPMKPVVFGGMQAISEFRLSSLPPMRGGRPSDDCGEMLIDPSLNENEPSDDVVYPGDGNGVG